MGNYGYDNNAPSVLYVLELISTNEHFIKIGISNNFEQRKREIKTDYFIEDEIVFYFNLGKEAYEIEQRILNGSFSKYMPQNILFKGKTECFNITEKTKLLEMLKQTAG